MPDLTLHVCKPASSMVAKLTVVVPEVSPERVTDRFTRSSPSPTLMFVCENCTTGGGAATASKRSTFFVADVGRSWPVPAKLATSGYDPTAALGVIVHVAVPATSVTPEQA